MTMTEHFTVTHSTFLKKTGRKRNIRTV